MSRTLMAATLLVSAVGVLAASCGSTPLQPGSIQADTAQAAKMTRMSPTSGPVGTQVTITGTGFAAQGNTVKFGSGYVKNLDSPDGATLRFTIPDGLDLCPPNATRPCPGAYPRVAPGDYGVAVLEADDTGSVTTFTVTRP